MPVADTSTTAPANLSPVQAQVIAALAEGATVSGAARQADIHRTTIHHWIRNHPEFKAAAAQAQAEYAAALIDEMRELCAQALKTLRNLLERSDVPPAVRLKAALAVLNRPHFPQPGRQLDSADRLRLLILLPARAGKIAANDTLDRHDFRLADEHRAAHERRGVHVPRQIEIADDLRLDGTAPRSAAKHVPIIE